MNTKRGEGNVAKLKIAHPKTGTTLRHANFAASGSAADVTAVTGKLTGAAGHKYSGTVLRQPPNWIIYFSNVDTSDTYTLEVKDTAGAAPPASSTGITISPVGIEGIEIDDPLTNATVCDDFVAYGVTNEASPIHGTMTKGTDVINGITIQDPPDWVILFLDVPLGNPYTLEVFNDLGSAAAPETNITVVGCIPGEEG